ncbi:very-long-chain (3R)-3-hydroxyacyl-CoA dehydratase hpo-8 [Ostrinia nubilalis]|uniref:very-long-chain (3R)-3-hydroxyacyl-CoA dehydratase hpo-8 n=1 Tax=Ostrinia furnacalis TaxID=93504 RepID=UPI001039E301|nr:very-long-chain (3R)-3-hydroxyacyl-CoA dehydratase hpo-8 [Ostrinia furnacalis]XP_028162436.1 very-long-chain (3R)-3-hydroxyacyl-CoA dehydratase hpo-8 [Ostrinia furnacalis]XP_028162437.1 very-long-chain (3R)-3-hydroxyacyl-CoA dehydratase hpo-8 [Ostrinia furnacalis]
MSEKTAKKTVRRSGPSAIGKSYLLAYNFLQTLGWSYLLWQSLVYFLNRGTLDAYWDEIKWTLYIFQGGAILEILHSLLGLVSSGILVVTMQVHSRVFLVFAILMALHSATVSPGLPLCILAWSITEIVRYAFYGLNLINAVPQTLSYLRYSTFLILYPLGVTGEILCMYHSLDEIVEKKLYTVSFPNDWNVAFNFYYFMYFYMFMYFPLFPYLFGHMLKQRRKVLGDDTKKTK